MNKVKASVSFDFPIEGEAIKRNIELAGRTCYKSEDKITADSAGKFIRTLIKSGHESVLEHEKISIRVICDRGVSHEIVRHRINSFSQESTRYCDYGNGKITFIDLCGYVNEEQYVVWSEAMLAAERAYEKLRELGVKPQLARNVLPNSLKTELVWTADLRQWRLILNQRCARAAHPQMREIAFMILEEFVRLLPEVFDDIAERYAIDKVTPV